MILVQEFEAKVIAYPGRADTRGQRPQWTDVIRDLYSGDSENDSCYEANVFRSCSNFYNCFFHNLSSKPSSYYSEIKTVTLKELDAILIFADSPNQF